MASGVVVASEAEEDLANIVACIATTLASPSAATSFLDGFDALVRIVGRLPESCPRCQESRLYALGYRKATIKRYVALYRTERDVVYVAHVFHSSQDYARQL